MKTRKEIEKEILIIQQFVDKYRYHLNEYGLGALKGKIESLEWVISDCD